MKIMKFITVLSCITLLLSLQSCKKFLDEVPDNRTEITSVTKLKQLTATAYPTAHYITFAEAASDNAEEKERGVGSLNEMWDKPYYWEDTPGTGTNSAGSYWNGCYEAIAAANQALQSIKDNNFGNAALPYKGEALVARAYAHFMLAVFFAKPYRKGGDNSSPGIPYVTEPETTPIKEYSRGTVEETYAKIKKDLEEGLPLLSTTAYSVPKYHFTPAAAHAFASRFYLFTSDWQKVIDHATLTVPGNDFVNNMRPVSTTLYDMTLADYRANYTKTEQRTALLLGNAYSTYTYIVPNKGEGNKVVKMFTQPNVTGKLLANKVAQFSAGNYNTYKYLYYFFYTGPGIGFPYLVVPLFSVDETLMNRAEAYAQLGNNEAALADINDFMKVRIRNYNSTTDVVTLAKISAFYSITDPKQGLIQTILDAKKAEFLEEGIRWMDIVRSGLTVKHNSYSSTGVESFIELKPDDPRRLFQLPNEVKLSGVELNPR